MKKKKKMKAIGTYMFLLLTIAVRGQKLPAFNSNAGTAEKSKSLVYTTHSKRYDAVIAYEKACALRDPSRQSYYILAHRDNLWKFFEWKVEFKDGTTDKKKIKKARILEQPVNLKLVDSLFNYFTAQGFWTFSTDSLNTNEKMENGNPVQKFIPDACTDVFEVFTKKDYYVLKVTSADDYQEFVYNKQREKFIHCREKFHQLLLIK